MREAIGGTMLMNIVITFLAIYIMFMAAVINYGRVFRVKNTLINLIEAEEGFKVGGSEIVKNKAVSMGYYDDIHVCYTKGNQTKYFSILVYINFDLPLVTNNIRIPITGDTSAIRDISNNVEGISECNGDLREASYKLQ